GMAREVMPPLEHRDLELGFRSQILPDESFDPPDQLDVLQDEELRIEDPRFLLARVALRPRADGTEALAGARERRVKALDLGGNDFVGNDALRHLRNFPEEQMHGTNDDPGRRRNTDELPVH